MTRLHAAQFALLAAGTVLAAAVTVLVLSRCLADQPDPTGPARAPLPSPEQIAALPADGGPHFNRLIHEKSPYLLQHARNPVDWYPWGPEAFAKARRENKPVFLSVGYSTCHWCHVMEHESFERKDVAEILNAHYVCIKVDREERPDIDGIYMLATQMLTGRGGWPNSVWLTPDGRPWFAGTYYPREDRNGQMGFKTLLKRLAAAWKQHNGDLLDRAAKIDAALKRYAAGRHVPAGGRLSADLVTAAVAELAGRFDPARGGFGPAPKFPPHGALRLLLDVHRRRGDANALAMATRTLEAMALGGIRDHLAGGFHRYSTDAVWLVPHFEKMLYDNAQLARAYVEAFQATGRENFRTVAEQTLDWALREMRDPAGGFHSALDADSEGEEGRFYLWTPAQVREILGEDDGRLFCRVYNIVEGGNWFDAVHGRRPGTSIPHLAGPLDRLAAEEKLTPAALRKRLADARARLLARRVRRPWPARDDKVLADWNALMISALAYAGRVLHRDDYLRAAEQAADFILLRMRRKDGRLLHAWRAGSARIDACLDDYAFLADALLELHAATGSAERLRQARATAGLMIRHFADEAGGFFFTPDDHEQLLARPRDPTDAALPAGNAVAASVLLRLAQATGSAEYRRRAGKTLEAFQGFMARMPSATASMILATAEYLDQAGAAGTPRAPDARPLAVADSRPVRVEAFASPAKLAPGRTTEITLRITIDPGWHVNSHKPAAGLVATAVALEKGSPAELGTVRYPPGQDLKLAFSPEALSVYTGTVTLAVPLRLRPDARPGKARVVLLVTTQPCDDRACLAPRTDRLAVELTVAPAG